MTQASATQRSSPPADMHALRPFHVNFSDTELADLRQRLRRYRFAEAGQATARIHRNTAA